MKAGIITDSHDHHANVLKAIQIFNERRVKYVFHAGDIVAPFTAKKFAEVQGAKFIAVFGNNDGERVNLRATIAGFGGEISDYAFEGTVEGKKIFMTHSQHYIEDAAKSQEHDLVIYGHTHKEDIRRVGRTLIMNPGESTDWLTGRAQVVILELDSLEYEIVEIK